jgi:hypothetical protein
MVWVEVMAVAFPLAVVGPKLVAVLRERAIACCGVACGVGDGLA